MQAGNCETFAILSAPDCTWLAASATASGDDLVLAVDDTSLWTAGSRAIATRAYYGNWPVVTVTNAHGTPLAPWLEYIGGANQSACPLIEPSTPTPKPSP